MPSFNIRAIRPSTGTIKNLPMVISKKPPIKRLPEIKGVGGCIVYGERHPDQGFPTMEQNKLNASIRGIDSNNVKEKAKCDGQSIEKPSSKWTFGKNKPTGEGLFFEAKRLLLTKDKKTMRDFLFDLAKIGLEKLLYIVLGNKYIKISCEHPFCGTYLFMKDVGTIPPKDSVIKLITEHSSFLRDLNPEVVKVHTKYRD